MRTLCALTEARILIVDDVPDSLWMLEVMLRAAGYQHVRGIHNPEQVITVFEEWSPDLLILDLMMPVVDGFEVMRRLRPLLADDYFPILVMTGNVAPSIRQRALQAGALDFLAKPYDNVEVQLRTRNLLQTRVTFLNLQAELESLRQRYHAVCLELEAARNLLPAG